ncbi:hypothetical protein JCM1393_20180 [Clostridium carnis]
MLENGYTVISNKIICDENLTLEEKFLLIALKQFDHSKSGVVYPTYIQLMKICNTKRRIKISKIIKSLQEKNYINVKSTGRANHYYFIKDYLLERFYTKNTNTIGIESETSEEIACSKNETSEGMEIACNEENDNNRCSKIKTSEVTKVDVKEENRNFRDFENRTAKASSCSIIETSDVTPVDTIKVNNKNKIYINNIYKLINYWNSKESFNNYSYNENINDLLDKAIKTFGYKEIIKGIDNYHEVYKSDFYYNYLWDFESFISKSNGISRFITNGDM